MWIWQDCLFHHKVLQEGEHICYKSGLIFLSTTDLIKHIKGTHGNTICHKFLRGQCTFNSKCLFSHSVSKAPPTPVPTAQDFPNALPTSSPVVGVQGRANSQQMQQVPILNQEQLMSVTTQVIAQMMPLIMSQVSKTLAAINKNPQ